MQMIVKLKYHIQSEKDSNAWPTAKVSSDIHNNCSDLPNGGKSVTADADGSAGAVSYIDIGKYAYGSRGERAAQLSMYVTNVGIATAYIIFVANTMADAVQGNHVRGELQTLLCYFRRSIHLFTIAGTSNMVEKLVGAIDLNVYTLILLPGVIALCQLRSLSFIAASR